MDSRKDFLYKYRDLLDFLQLTANPSVPDHLIRATPDLPWNLGTDNERLPIPKGHLQCLAKQHTVSDQNEWNYIEAACSPFWTWEKWAGSLDSHMSDPCWPDRFGRWFFHNWSRNPAIMKNNQSIPH